MIELNDIAKKYGNKLIFEHVDLKIEDGEFVCIVGNSGEGKSTLLNILGLFDIPTSGDYLIDGVSVIDKSVDKSFLRRNKFGFVFQSFYLIDDLSVYENVKIPLIYNEQRENVSERITDALVNFGLNSLAEQKTKDLSGGEKQRVAFVRAIINNPKYIFCDEPTGNLDKKNSAEIINFLEEQNKAGKTVILISHDYSIIENLKSKGATVYEIADRKITKK